MDGSKGMDVTRLILLETSHPRTVSPVQFVGPGPVQYSPIFNGSCPVIGLGPNRLARDPTVVVRGFLLVPMIT